MKKKYLFRIIIFFIALFATITFGSLSDDTELKAACYTSDGYNDGKCIASYGGPWYCVDSEAVSTPCNVGLSSVLNKIFHE